MAKIKQVILIRKDLKMRRGKEIAQGSHASMEFLANQIRHHNPNESVDLKLNDIEMTWLKGGVAKVCLRVNSEQELFQYHQQAQDAGLKSFLIRDSGKTEFQGQPTYTACAIGPDLTEKIDSITGELTLY